MTTATATKSGTMSPARWSATWNRLCGQLARLQEQFGAITQQIRDLGPPPNMAGNTAGETRAGNRNRGGNTS